MWSMWEKFGLGSLAVASGMLISFTLATDVTEAKVTGVCSNCHTMHNSQNGNSMVVDGAGVGWDNTGKLAGSLSTTPQGRLLIAGCVGCHSSTYNETIINLGGSRIPIVYNTAAYPSQPLAGGNFYYTAKTGTDAHGYKYESYGHNVYGIVGVDTELPTAPGSEVGCANSCHNTLATADNILHKPGCEGCHTEVFHHTDNSCYRFLSGKSAHTFGAGTPWVEGVEDPNWEQNPATGHNTYKGKAGPVTTEFLGDTHSMSGYCGGCHKKFHWYNSAGADKGTGASSPWLRHPSDILLPQGTTEYAAYDPLQPNKYRNDAPVAYTNPLIPLRTQAVVMCLSCHRPHGSDQPDLLRWEYRGMNAHQGDNPSGCFACHTTKDDV